jgi:hypothetical protein
METLLDVFGNFSRSWLLLREATKKGLIVATALVACTVGLTFMSGFAQAQTAAVAQGQALRPQFLDPSRFFAFDCRVGPRSGDITFRCFNLTGVSATPFMVQCQTRNSNSQPTSFPDQFACQIIRTAAEEVTFRIRRIDDGNDGLGWGQDLHVNLLIFN